MSILFNSGAQRVDFVLHPTDLSQASERAFHHALAIAMRNGAQFTLLHAVGRRATDNWVDFPSVRSKLAEWRAAGTMQPLEPNVGRASISKIEVPLRDPVAACKQYIERNGVDMIVLATNGRSGLSRLLGTSRAQKLARESRLLTLFVPDGGRHFVSAETGEVTLNRILVPVDPATDPRPAMLHAVQAAVTLDDPSVEITLLHVGEAEESTLSDASELPFCKWNVIQRSGGIVEQILSVTDEIMADAVYMSTTWSKAGFGKVEGGVTERVLDGAPCPVMAVPVDRE